MKIISEGTYSRSKASKHNSQHAPQTLWHQSSCYATPKELVGLENLQHKQHCIPVQFILSLFLSLSLLFFSPHPHFHLPRGQVNSSPPGFYTLLGKCLDSLWKCMWLIHRGMKKTSHRDQGWINVRNSHLLSTKIRVQPSVCSTCINPGTGPEATRVCVSSLEYGYVYK